METYKGKFKPKNPEKYKGDPTNIIYRSLWERKCMVKFDESPNIIEWRSEEVAIPYLSPLDNRVHRYFPDFIIKVREKSGETKTYVVEVKPKRQTRPPVTKSKTTKSYIHECKTYAVNQAKWKYAKEYCEDRLIEFKIITEDELGIK